MKKIKIAHITKTLAVNGISTVIMNYCSNLSKEKFETIIISGNPVDYMYTDFCKRNDIELVILNCDIHSPQEYYLSLFKALKKQRIDIVHIHGNSATISLELMLAKLAGIKNRIAHSHNSTCTHKKIHYLLKPIFNHLYTKGLACSRMAGNWLFGEGKYTVIKNGFDITRFFYSQELRDITREQLGLSDKYVIVNVARFTDQKNHPFLISIFTEIAKQRDDVVLLLIGDGPNLPFVKKLIKENPYRDRILYLGTLSQVEKIYNAGDVFLLPSKYEGLGIVFIEAQISGMPVVTSDMVPKEVNIGGMASFLSLDESPVIWGKEVMKKRSINRKTIKEKYSKKIDEYDIQKNVRVIEKIYINLHKSKNVK